MNPLALRVTVTREREKLEVAAERVVLSGDAIRTDSTGRALVMYRDGSTVLLDVDSELVIEFVGSENGDVVVRMRQTLGRAWYSVSRALSAESRYEVRSAALAAVIRAGSGSFVAVDANGETTIVATEGSVQADAGGVSVTLPAGTTTRVVAGSPPSSPVPGVAPPPPAAKPTPRATAFATATPTPTADSRGASGGNATRAGDSAPDPHAEPDAPAIGDACADADACSNGDTGTHARAVVDANSVAQSHSAAADDGAAHDDSAPDG
ncbi:MAG: FecR domain-containing protein, partial [Chloroflexi bacterium]